MSAIETYSGAVGDVSNIPMIDMQHKTTRAMNAWSATAYTVTLMAMILKIRLCLLFAHRVKGSFVIIVNAWNGTLAALTNILVWIVQSSHNVQVATK